MSQKSKGPTLRGNIRELPSPAWFLVAGAFINRFASFAVVFLVLYLTEQGFTVARAGAALASYGLGEVLAAVVGGHLADRIGRRITIALSMYASAAAVLALSQVEPYPAILGVAFLAGLAFETHRPAALALVADVVRPSLHITAFAVLRLAANLGFASGVAVAGFLATRSFFWVFLTDAATSVVFGTMALVALPRGRISRREEEVGLPGYRAALGDRAFLLFLLASVLVAFVYFQVQATLPLHVVASGLTKADYGLLMALNGLIVVLIELPLTTFTMRATARHVIALSFLLVGAGFGLVAVADTFPLLVVTVVIWSLGEVVGVPVGYAYVAAMAPEHMRGRYQGLYGLALGAGGVIGPSLGAVLFAGDAGAFWTLCGGLGVISAILVMVSRPRHAVVPEVASLAGLVDAPDLQLDTGH